MQDGRDNENSLPERDPAQPGSDQPAPSAGTGPGEPEAGSAGASPAGASPAGASWVPTPMTTPEDQPSPAAPTPEDQPSPAAPSPAQPDHPQPGYGPPGYVPPTYGPPSYAQPGYGPPGYGQQPGYGQPGYGPPGHPWQGPQGTQPIWAGPGQQQPWGPPPAAGPPYGGQPQGSGAWPPYPAELSGAAPPAGQAPWAPPPGTGYGQPPPAQPPPSRGPLSRALVYVLVAALAAAIGAGAVFALRGSPGNSPGISSRDIPKPRTNTSGNGSIPGLNVSAVARKVEPGMVDITSRLKLSGQVFEGTGMVLSSSGLVLTNNHVINGATRSSLHATLVSNGHSYTAQIVGWDETQDVALLKLVGASGLRTIQPGNSGQVKLFQQVVALGNAGGQGGSPTVTAGRITSLNRTIKASDAGSDTSEVLHGMLQTSAPIAPGDSGGPLANSAGQVIGMNTAANTANLGAGNSQGYSIPIDTALSIVRQMAAGHGSGLIHLGQPPFLGIAIASTANGATSTATSPRVQLRQLERIANTDGGSINSSGSCLANDEGSPVPHGSAPATSGALVGAVFCGTPAQTAGLQGGDVIVSLGGHDVTSATSLHTAISDYHPGNTVSLTWVELNGQRHTGSLTLAAGPVK